MFSDGGRSRSKPSIAMIFSTLRIPIKVPSTFIDLPLLKARCSEIMLRYSGLSGVVETLDVTPRSAASPGALT
jgi:hypothetical protein